MKLLDTTFLIHYWGGHEATAAYLEANEDSAFLTSTLSMKEIAVGLECKGVLDRAELATAFEWVEIVPFEFKHAVAAGVYEAALHQDDSVAQDEINALYGDLLIAAVAETEGASVVTRNVDDFERFGVDVETY